MKIAFITELFYPSIGGQEIRFEELGQEIVNRGHEVSLYTIHIDKESPRNETRNGINVCRILRSRHYKLKRFKRNPIDILRFSVGLFLRLDELRRFDAVIFNIWPLLPQFLLAPFLGGKCIIDICETRSGLFWKFIYRCFTYIPRIRFLGVNPEIIRHMVRVHGVALSAGKVVVSGVDLSVAGAGPFVKDSKQLLFFGRMTEHKNPRLLAEAFYESGIHEAGFHLEIAGGGPELESLKETCKFPGIEYHGRVSEDEKWNLLRKSSLLVMPSRREGFPRVVAEGACVGTPTLTLDYPDNGTCSVVNDYGIGKICPGSKKALIDELKRFAMDQSEFSAIAQHCIALPRLQFSWDTVTDQLIEFLNAKDE